MNRKIRKIAIPIICRLIYFLTVLTPLSSHVLCLGADGHIEFEAAINGRCTDVTANAWAQSKVAFTALTSSEDPCGSCLDIPIFASNGDQQVVVPVKNTSSNLSVSTVAIITIQQPASATIPTHISRIDFPTRINPTLIALRTVTLLI